MTPPDLRAHGLSTRHLNYLFALLFGFPAIMGAVLAWQSWQPAWPSLGNEAPVALAAPSKEETPMVFEQMLNPFWQTPRELEDFAKDDVFAARFANLEQKKLVAILDLPEQGEEVLTASLPELAAPLITYGDVVPSGQFNMSAEDNDAPVMRPANAGETIAGRADVIDPLTLSVGSQRVRLAGLELPESGNACTLLNGEKGDCRKAATDQLGFFLRWRAVTCTVGHESSGGLPLAECRVGESDVGEWLVRRGWATPDPASTQNYRAALLFAQSYKLGQWRP